MVCCELCCLSFSLYAGTQISFNRVADVKDIATRRDATRFDSTRGNATRGNTTLLLTVDILRVSAHSFHKLGLNQSAAQWPKRRAAKLFGMRNLLARGFDAVSCRRRVGWQPTAEPATRRFKLVSTVEVIRKKLLLELTLYSFLGGPFRSSEWMMIPPTGPLAGWLVGWWLAQREAAEARSSFETLQFEPTTAQAKPRT